jgi:uncharacterized protein (UPF0332 family)
MPFDWNNFLTLAHELATKMDEASKRTAISRAYYCAFNFALPRAVANVGPRPRDVPSHQWCWNQYIRTAHPACKQLGITGQRMKDLRVKADYHAEDIAKDIRRLDEKVQRMLQEAHDFLADLTALDRTYPRRP